MGERLPPEIERRVMPSKNEGSDKARPDGKPTRKKVGDRTPNPFPDKDISTPQPPADDNQANP
jgi:hypothetical protein